MENSRIPDIYFQHTPQRISIPCISLCILIVVILGVLPIVPATIAKIVKPAFIVLCVVFFFFFYYHFGYEKWLMVFLAYLFVILIANLHVDPNSVSEYISMLLFALFFLCAGLRIWNRLEIRMILDFVVLACFTYAVIVIVSNHGLLLSSGDQHIRFFSQTLNRNTSSFAVVPGTVAALLMLFYGKKSPMRTIFSILAFLVCFYTVVALSCRSAFLAAVSGAFLIVWQATREHADKGRRFGRRTFFLILVFVFLLIGMDILEGTNSSRLFDYSYTGRDGLWDAAWELILEKPVFGGGFGYWARSGQVMSPHNTFLNYMMISGFVGGIFFVLMIVAMLVECMKAHNIVALAFATEMILHSISEAGLDYYAYIPLILETIVLRYTEYQGQDVFEIFN